MTYGYAILRPVVLAVLLVHQALYLASSALLNSRPQVVADLVRDHVHRGEPSR
jgi:hypothetical protein